jgi:hypothetical protein
MSDPGRELRNSLHRRTTMKSFIFAAAVALSMGAGSAYAAVIDPFVDGYGRAGPTALAFRQMAFDGWAGNNLPARQIPRGDSRPVQVQSRVVVQNSGLNGGGG